MTPDKTQVAFFERPKMLAAARALSAPIPLLVLQCQDPWKIVIGSDSPTFALYSNGTVIFRQKDGYRSAQLTAAATAALIKAFTNPALIASAGAYQASDSTDQPNNNLLIYGYTTPHFISIYGSLEDEEVRSKLPRVVLKAFKRLREFSLPGARPWLPARFEVMLSPYENASDQSVIWPERWPNLSTSATRKRGDSYSIFIPTAELPALEAFLATRKAKGAIEVDGRKWAASIRLPFLHEELWMAPNNEVTPQGKNGSI